LINILLSNFNIKSQEIYITCISHSSADADKCRPGYVTVSTRKQKAVFFGAYWTLKIGTGIFPKTWLNAIEMTQS